MYGLLLNNKYNLSIYFQLVGAFSFSIKKIPIILMLKPFPLKPGSNINPQMNCIKGASNSTATLIPSYLAQVQIFRWFFYNLNTKLDSMSCHFILLSRSINTHQRANCYYFIIMNIVKLTSRSLALYTVVPYI